MGWFWYTGSMAKQKKKRNKVYKGPGAARVQPSVTRISAVNRGRVGQWWFDRKRWAKPALIATGVVIVIIWLFVELVQILGGSGA